jgi:hypothetical protein
MGAPAESGAPLLKSMDGFDVRDKS